jgi:hypothetical protein
MPQYYKKHILFFFKLHINFGLRRGIACLCMSLGRILFDAEDGGDRRLQNVGFSPSYTASQPRKSHRCENLKSNSLGIVSALLQPEFHGAIFLFLIIFVLQFMTVSISALQHVKWWVG